MPTLTEGRDIGDVVAFEEQQQYSREVVTIASGAGVLEPGEVLGEVTASSKFVPSPDTGGDGSQTATAVLLTAVDATDADVVNVPVLARHAIVRSFGLSFDSSVDDAAKVATKHDQLKAVGILVSPSA